MLGKVDKLENVGLGELLGESQLIGWRSRGTFEREKSGREYTTTSACPLSITIYLSTYEIFQRTSVSHFKVRAQIPLFVLRCSSQLTKTNYDDYSAPISTVEFYPDNVLNGDRRMTSSKPKSFNVHRLIDTALSLHITNEQARKAKGMLALRCS